MSIEMRLDLKVDGEKDYTTGQAAKICRVAPRTITKWFDSGELKGFRIPGSKFRRIPREYLAEFMRGRGMICGEGEVYTTGKVAKILKVSQQTIIRRFDNDEFEDGYRIPGSEFRRIPHESLVRFAERYELLGLLKDYFGIRVVS